MDRLEAIIEKQRELQSRVDNRYMSDDPAVRAAFMRDHRGYLADEVAEALYEMPNYKLWKDYSDMSPEKRGVQWQKVRMELIDSLHFFVNLLIGADMTAEEIYQMYMAKNNENHRRQDAGYTSDVSYRDQGVDEVMKNYCTVHLNGETITAENFIVLAAESTTGEYNLLQNADSGPFGIVTLGTAANVIYNMYQDALGATDAKVAEAIKHMVNENVMSYGRAKDEQN